MSQTCRVHIRKEAYKFSCAHMTVFPDGTKERLHGHNYQVEVEVQVLRTDLSQMIEFKEIKDVVRAICQDWDEYVLLPARCPYLVIERESPEELEFRLCGRRYVLPADEVIKLDTDNVISESLAELFCTELVLRLERMGTKFLAATVRVDETAGQGASFDWSRS